MSEELKNLMNNVTSSLKLESIDEKEREELLSELSKTIMEDVFVLALKELPEEKHEILVGLGEEDDYTKLYQFLEKEIPDFSSKVRERAGQTVAEFIAVFEGKVE